MARGDADGVGRRCGCQQKVPGSEVQGVEAEHGNCKSTVPARHATRLSELPTGNCGSQEGRQVCPPENAGEGFAILDIIR